MLRRFAVTMPRAKWNQMDFRRNVFVLRNVKLLTIQSVETTVKRIEANVN